uniref:Reverse transcriptase domain-containing protein n=1 Tax=Tanacetum cinerariifolium TaxID=118510 RepID=A0A6L2JXC4_TANCI|nr:reverse transcriptase domain-containing protein [Tanacetum cinerariifolium]
MWQGPTLLGLDKGKGHYRRECLKLKNQNRGTQAGNGDARGRAYALGGGEANQVPNVVTGTFLLNNRYASILFDTSDDRSFVSTTFSSLIDIIPTALDAKYAVELADGKVIGAETIIQGCTLNLLNNPFDIDLMPIELGSVDVIIGSDVGCLWEQLVIGLVMCSVLRLFWSKELVVMVDFESRINIILVRIVWNEKEHEEHLRLILEFLMKEELYAKFSKYELWLPKVKFLSHVIDSQGIHVDPTKIESIKGWAMPMTSI